MNFIPDTEQSNEANTRALGTWVETLGYKVSLLGDECFILHGRQNIGVWFTQPGGVPKIVFNVLMLGSKNHRDPDARARLANELNELYNHVKVSFAPDGSFRCQASLLIDRELSPLFWSKVIRVFEGGLEQVFRLHQEELGQMLD
jgi:hypothetical protein